MNNITNNRSKDSENDKVGCIDNQRLRNLRKKVDISQAKLAKNIGISLQGISRLERHPTVITTETLVRLARFFEVPCGYLLGETEIELTKYAADDQLAKKIRELLDRIVSVDRRMLASTINDFMLLVEAKSKEPEQPGSIVYEEEIVGLWWSIISAYQRCDWRTMIGKSNRLIEMAGGLKRPYLVALGLSYKAKALRSLGAVSELQQAESILTRAEKDVGMESALIHRMRGKVLVRQKRFQDALEEYSIALKEVESSKRNDALFHLEKTKLFRNLSTVHQRLAKESFKDGKMDERKKHLDEAMDFMGKCKESISHLAEHTREEAKTEEILLYSCEANFNEACDRRDAALRSAEKTLEKAIQLKNDGIATRTRMYLFHLNMVSNHEHNAMKYLVELFPLEKYRHGRFARHYENFVKKYEDEIESYIKEQIAQVET